MGETLTREESLWLIDDWNKQSSRFWWLLDCVCAIKERMPPSASKFAVKHVVEIIQHAIQFVKFDLSSGREDSEWIMGRANKAIKGE